MSPEGLDRGRRFPARLLTGAVLVGERDAKELLDSGELPGMHPVREDLSRMDAPVPGEARARLRQARKRKLEGFETEVVRAHLAHRVEILAEDRVGKR